MEIHFTPVSGGGWEARETLITQTKKIRVENIIVGGIKFMLHSLGILPLFNISHFKIMYKY